MTTETRTTRTQTTATQTTAAQTPAAQTTAAQTTETHAADARSTVSAYLKALGDKNIAALLAIVSEDVEYRIPGDSPLAGTWRGRDQVFAGFVGPMAELFDPDAPYATEVLRTVAEGDTVAVQCVTRGTTRDGRGYENPIVALFTVQDGKIVRVDEYFDTAYFSRTLFPNART